MLLAAVAAAPVAAEAPKHFEVEATLERAAAPGGGPVVAVRFSALDPDVNVNEIPAPRLELDERQTLLSSRAVKTKAATPPMSADEPRYLDLSEPVRFPVAVSPDAPTGIHGVSADVVYFYCSKRQGWCRRGTAPVTIPIVVSR